MDSFQGRSAHGRKRNKFQVGGGTNPFDHFPMYRLGVAFSQDASAPPGLLLYIPQFMEKYPQILGRLGEEFSKKPDY